MDWDEIRRMLEAQNSIDQAMRALEWADPLGRMLKESATSGHFMSELFRQRDLLDSYGGAIRLADEYMRLRPELDIAAGFAKTLDDLERSGILGLSRLPDLPTMQSEWERILDEQELLARTWLPESALLHAARDFEWARAALADSDFLEAVRAAAADGSTHKRRLRETFGEVLHWAEEALSRARPASLEDLTDRELAIAGIRIAIWSAILSAIFAIYIDRNAAEETAREHNELKTEIRELRRDMSEQERRRERADKQLQQLIRKAVREAVKASFPPRWQVRDRAAPIYDRIGRPARRFLEPGSLVREVGDNGKWLRIEFEAEGTTMLGWTLRKYFERVENDELSAVNKAAIEGGGDGEGTPASE